MSQKQSDATLGDERVYDTETGEIYKATNGFTDVYDGKRYKAVTDDNMYAEVPSLSRAVMDGRTRSGLPGAGFSS